MRKLRLRENKVFSIAYKASKIGACANSYSGQMKIWNSGCKVSTGTCETGLWSVGLRAKDDFRGEAEQSVEE